MSEILAKIESDIEAKVTPANRAYYNRVVLAGEKILFDEKTHQNMELIRNPETRKDPVKTISNGLVGLMWLMFQQSKQKMPTEVLIMAGTTLLTKVIDFAIRGLNIPMDNAMIAATMKELTYNLFAKLGITPEKLNEAIKVGSEKKSDEPQAEQQAEPQAPVETQGAM